MSIFAKAIQSLWKDVCTISEKSEVRHGAITSHKDVVLYKDVPCRLSYSTKSVAVEGKEYATVSQVINLFLPKDIDVPYGSKIEVVRDGVTTLYKKSSPVRRYSTHIEVNVDVDTEA